MWIVLSIIAIYVWLFKRKKKTIKHPVPKVILFVLIIIEAKGICMAQNKEVIISGEIQTIVQNKGKIIVFLVDATSFNIPFSGVDTLIVKPIASIVNFTFNSCKQGSYGIRCFHDLNNNGILDKGMFGPTEPYGFSWKSGKKYPFDFSDISFFAESNRFITIKMED